jgi:pantoate--beta-alanine ligase
VTKLLNLVQPDVALFGEKDFQQLMVIRRAAEDLCMPIEIVGVPTTREPDGLAMSSRNRYLTAEQRAAAPSIFAALERARVAIESGSRDYSSLEKQGIESLQQAGFRTDYFSIRGAATLQAPGEAPDLVILTAARIGRARLIDNVRAKRP